MMNCLSLLLVIVLAIAPAPAHSDKTINVEIDWLEHADHSHKPQDCELAELVRVFQARGYTLNCVLSSAIPEDLTNACIDLHGPTIMDSTAGIWATLETTYRARDHLDGSGWHYCIFAHNITIDGGDPGHSGAAEIPGDEFVVSLGSFEDRVGDPIGTPFEREATFMHELGHNFGLDHAGDQDKKVVGEYKPNYRSLMCFRYQMRGVVNGIQCDHFAWSPAGENLDYSSGRLSELNEEHLWEGYGIGLGKWVDWNCDHNKATDWVMHDVSNGRDLDPDPYDWCLYHVALSRLTDYNDWAQVARATSNSEIMSQPQRFVSCITATEAAALRISASGCEQPDPCQLLPEPANCDVPGHLRVVTPRGSGVDSTATYTVVVRDSAGNPMPGIRVWLNFYDCDQVRLASEQPYYEPHDMECPSDLGGWTDAAGRASFIVLGSVLRREASEVPDLDTQCVTVVAGFTAIGHASPAAYDQDGVNGLTANDLSLVCCDFVSGYPYARSDINGDGDVTAADVAAWCNQYFDAHGASRTPARCDTQLTTFPQTVLYPSPLRVAWGTCASQGGQQIKTFSCATNVGSDHLEASFVAPPGVERMTGFEAELRLVVNEGTPFPYWWILGADGCRPSPSISLSGSCEPLTPDPGIGVVRMERTEWEHVALIRVIGAMPPAAPYPTLTPGQEYSLFSLVIGHSRTVGSPCSGCATPAAIVFNSLRLTQAPLDSARCLAVGPADTADIADIVLLRDRSTGEAVAFWQAESLSWSLLDTPDAVAPRAMRLTVTNPFRDAARVEFALPRPLHCLLALYDIAGRTRRVLLDANVSAGPHALTWDGRDSAGRPLGSGFYIMRLVTTEGTLTRPLIRLR